MHSKSFKELGQAVIRQTKVALFVGSANILEDQEKTGDWTRTLLGFIRHNRSWIDTKLEDKKVVLSDEQLFLQWKKMKNNAQNKTKTKPRWLTEQISYFPQKQWQTKFEGKITYESASHDAARASYYKAGNCEEMANVAAYYLMKFFLKPDLQKFIVTQHIKISIVSFPRIFDHVVAKLEFNVKDKDNPAARESIFIDPWLGVDGCFTLKEFAVYRQKIFEKLLQVKIDSINNQSFDPIEKARQIAAIKLKFKESFNNLTVKKIEPKYTFDSLFSFYHYINSFDAEMRRLNCEDKSEHFAKKMLESIEAGNTKNVAVFLDAIVDLSQDIINSAVISGDNQILTLMQKKAIANSKYFLGDLSFIEIEKIKQNVFFIVKDNDEFFLMHKKSDNRIEKFKFEYGREKIQFGKYSISFNNIIEFDKFFQEEVGNRGMTVEMAIEMIATSDGDCQYAMAPRNEFKLLENAGQTPLHKAVQDQDAKSVENLLKNGADHNAPNSLGQTPVHFAMQLANEEVLLTLLANDQINLNVLDNEGRSPLYFRSGADVLKIAFGHEKLDVVQNILRFKNSNTLFADTLPIHSLFQRKNLSEAVKLFIEAKIDLSQLDDDGRDAFHIASIYNSSETLKDLAASDPNAVNSRDVFGNTPLVLNLLNEPKLETIQTLISLHADVNLPDGNKVRPLQIALQINEIDIACYLMMHKANMEGAHDSEIQINREILITKALEIVKAESDVTVRDHLILNFLNSLQSIDVFLPDRPPESRQKEMENLITNRSLLPSYRR